MDLGFPKVAAVDLPDERSLRVRRGFAAPPALVWQAFTEPALMRRWLLGPPGWEMHVCEMDVRVGGTFRWRWRSAAEGAEFGFHGSFSAVDAPRLLAHDEAFDPGTTGGNMAACDVRTEFRAEGTDTIMTTRIRYANAQDREAAMATGMTDGMEMSYARLDAELPGLTT